MHLNLARAHGKVLVSDDVRECDASADRAEGIIRDWQDTFKISILVSNIRVGTICQET